jgi:hypothetical protein
MTDDGGFRHADMQIGRPGDAERLTSKVESFEDDLVPFLGDPHASQTMGKVVQVAAGLLVAFHAIRAGLWAYFSVLTGNQVGQTFVVGSDRLVSVGRIIDATTVLFWPTLIAAVVVDAMWRRKRRPKDLLRTHGEAYVEATMTRVVPVAYRAGSLILVGAAVGVGVISNPARVRPTEVAGYAIGRSLASVLWALSWATLIVWVIASEHHLARRLAKAADPNLAGFSVPYVEPEVEQTTIGEPAGVGWILRTAGLVMVGMFALLIAIGSISMVASGKDTVAGLIWLAGSVGVLGLVTWAFVRRRRRLGEGQPHSHG